MAPTPHDERGDEQDDFSASTNLFRTDNPITIRAADGETPIVTRPVPVNFRYDQNNVEIVNSSYLLIKGLRFKGGETGNAISMNSGNTDSVAIRRNHIHHTGLLASAAGTTEGEGLYVGCNNAACVASIT
jgi:hypothetical protein